MRGKLRKKKSSSTVLFFKNSKEYVFKKHEKMQRNLSLRQFTFCIRRCMRKRMLQLKCRCHYIIFFRVLKTIFTADEAFATADILPVVGVVDIFTFADVPALGVSGVLHVYADLDTVAGDSAVAGIPTVAEIPAACQSFLLLFLLTFSVSLQPSLGFNPNILRHSII
jgi:hypothetical protein